MTTQQEIDSLTWHNAINKLKSILKKLTAGIGSITGYIPLAGTTVGNPITGILELKNDADTYFEFKNNSGVINGSVTNTGSDIVLNLGGISESTQLRHGIITTTNPSIVIQSDNVVNPRGLEGGFDYSANITDLAYPQKIYVDTKVSKVLPIFTSVPTYADNAAATAGGLIVGSVYRTALGVLMIRF